MQLLKLGIMILIAMFLISVSLYTEYEKVLDKTTFMFIPYFVGWLILIYCVIKIIN